MVKLTVIRESGTPGSKLSDQETHRLDAIAALPAVLGLLLGLVIVVRGWARRPIEWVCLLLGCLGCGDMLFSFGWEFFH